MITALVLLDRRIADTIKRVEVARILRFEAVCKKSGVVHSSPDLNHLKFYQKIAKALANYVRALIHL